MWVVEHEIGHYLGLFHPNAFTSCDNFDNIWDDPETNCSEQGDLCCDTHMISAFGPMNCNDPLPVEMPANQCTEELDPLYNIMMGPNGFCEVINFTDDQTTRMHYYLNTDEELLQLSSGQSMMETGVWTNEEFASQVNLNVSGCQVAGQSVWFSSNIQSILTFTELVAYLDFGDDSEPEPYWFNSHTYQNPGTYIASITIQTACSTIVYSISVPVVVGICDCVEYSGLSEGSVGVNSDATVDGIFDITQPTFTIGDGVHLFFGPDSKLLVHPGCELVLGNNVVLTSLHDDCPDMWWGIEVMPGGSISSSQTDACTIKNAHVGICWAERNIEYPNDTDSPNVPYYFNNSGVLNVGTIRFEDCGIGLLLPNVLFMFPIDMSENFFIYHTEFSTSEGGLTDPHYRTDHPQAYTNDNAPWFGPANFGGRMTRGILLHGIRNISLSNCDFENIEKGIVMFRSEVDVLDSEFDDLSYGVQVFQSNHDFYNTYPRISDNSFNHIRYPTEFTTGESGPYNYEEYPTAAVVVDYANNLLIHNNQFGLSNFPFSTQEDNIVGLYLSHMFGGTVYGNTFNEVERAAVVVDTYEFDWGGTLIGQPDLASQKNVFNGCDYNVITAEDNSFLTLRCNQFHNDDEFQAPYTTNWANVGLLQNQGVLNEIGEVFQNLGAGNQFSPFDRKQIKADYLSEWITGYNYSHQYLDQFDGIWIDPDGIRPVPDSPIIIANETNPLITFNETNSCTELEGVNKPDNEIEAALVEIDQAISDKWEEHTALKATIDGYNAQTENLLSAIYGAISNMAELRTYLMDNSPLSTTVLRAWMERMDVPAEYFADVVLMNSVVESELKELLNERIADLPSAISQQITAVLVTNPDYETLAEIKNQIASLQGKRIYLMDVLISRYINAHNDVAIENLLLSEETFYARTQQYWLYFHRQQFPFAHALLDNLAIENQEQMDWKSMATLYLQLAENQRSLFNLSPSEELQVRSIALGDPANEGAAWARNTLRELGEEQGIWMPVLTDDPNIRTFHYNATPESGFHIYPNPATEYVYLSLESDPGPSTQFILKDASGREVLRTTLSLKDERIDLSQLDAGSYTCFVIVANFPVHVDELIVR